MTDRSITELKYNWKFSREAVEDFESPLFNDSDWADVRVPHYWAIKWRRDQS